ncbi:MAG: hypothetical protein J4G14_12335 [Dehalococcoidia bacterium]|nr:hypothetical protein [Dehalococcoidia bacterium]
MNVRFDGVKISHRLTAARLLTIYAHEDGDDPDFDPYPAALNDDYFKSYTGCKDPECEVHGESPEIDFDPNDFHY